MNSLTERGVTSRRRGRDGGIRRNRGRSHKVWTGVGPSGLGMPSSRKRHAGNLVLRLAGRVLVLVQASKQRVQRLDRREIPGGSARSGV